MGLGKRILDVGNWAFNAISIDNLTPETGGGLTSAIIKKQVSPLGYGLLGLGTALGGIGSAGLQAANRRIMGQISYQDAPARVTTALGTGSVKAMMRASGGDYRAFEGMAQSVVKSPGVLNKIDDFGANPAMISALYNMGGR